MTGVTGTIGRKFICLAHYKMWISVDTTHVSDGQPA